MNEETREDYIYEEGQYVESFKKKRDDKNKAVRNLTILVAVVFVVLVGTISYFNVQPDYTMHDLVLAMEQDEDVSSKSFEFKVLDKTEVELNGEILSYTITTNFNTVIVTEFDRGYEVGKTYRAKVREYGNIMGSWIVTIYD